MIIGILESKEPTKNLLEEATDTVLQNIILTYKSNCIFNMLAIIKWKLIHKTYSYTTNMFTIDMKTTRGKSHKEKRSKSIEMIMEGNVQFCSVSTLFKQVHRSSTGWINIG
jgi:hypothetical protein